ncbi:transporter substrate-binding domain-containing protein [Saccharospirillum impatiens]|uniref:transporter substrate-binding domain-containing protein n=1 Tax=Saccharospirillum impatiens TaxID=169438 RepID=UPI000403575E|nr:transporter substrate-binding domain-containing protein [Saccharospirillum impatiens]
MNVFKLIGLLAATMSLTANAYTIAVTDANAGALSFRNDIFHGPLAPLYQCAIDAVGESFTVVTLPQARALRMLRNNEVDMVVPLAQSSERDAYAYFASPLLTVKYQLFTLPGTEVPAVGNGFLVAVNWSSAAIRLIEQQGHEVIPIDHHELAIGMVKRERAHGVVIPNSTAASMAETLDGLEPHDYAQLPGGVYIRQGNPMLQRNFDIAINDCLPMF